MDIKSLYTLESHEKGAELNLLSPLDGKPTDCYLTVVGSDSVAWRESELNGKRRVLELFKSGEGDNTKHNEVIAETLAGAVVGWKGFEDKGKELKFDKAFLKELFINSPFIADQVDTFIGNRANFIKG